MSIRLDSRTSVCYATVMCSGVDDITAADDLAALLDAVERLERRPRIGREGWLVREELRSCRRLTDRIELLFSSLVAELAGCGEDEWEGQSNPCDWVKEECRTSGITAWNALVVGEQAARLEQSCQAVRTGGIGWGHPMVSLCRIPIRIRDGATNGASGNLHAN